MNKSTLLLVDDEERILRSLSLLFRAKYRVLATTDARQALDMARTQRPHVVISDQRMPLMRGADLLREIRTISPNTMRILLTGYSELDAIVASVNEGEVFRFVCKPWDAAELEQTVAQATHIAGELFASAPALSMDAPAAPPAEVASSATVSPKGPGVLVLDEDAGSFEAVRALASPGQAVHWARSVDEAFSILQRERVGVLVSELSVGGDSTVTALKVLKAQHPELVSLVVTQFRDTGVLIELINQGQIYRFLPKPVRRTLAMSIASALRQHESLRTSAAMRASVAVEPVRSADDAGLAARVRSYLGRLRERSVASV